MLERNNSYIQKQQTSNANIQYFNYTFEDNNSWDFLFFFFCYKEVNDQTPYHIILDIFKIILKDKLVEEFHAYL